MSRRKKSPADPRLDESSRSSAPFFPRFRSIKSPRLGHRCPQSRLFAQSFSLRVASRQCRSNHANRNCGKYRCLGKRRFYVSLMIDLPDRNSKRSREYASNLCSKEADTRCRSISWRIRLRSDEIAKGTRICPRNWSSSRDFNLRAFNGKSPLRFQRKSIFRLGSEHVIRLREI